MSFPPQPVFTTTMNMVVEMTVVEMTFPLFSF